MRTLATILLALCASAGAQTLPPVLVLGHYDSRGADSASQGSVLAGLIASRPALRPGELLEFVPGVIVTQHSGDGKANQYFLRGFNLDHGTDFASYVDGMPVNMPSHAHGQGYSDLNWLMPELVRRIDYAKGPYRAEDGDFSAAGSARMALMDELPQGLASLSVGEGRYGRALLANSGPLGGGQLLYALDVAHKDGPWLNPENFRRANGLLRWSWGEKSSLTLMGYRAAWQSTDQIPQRAVEQGLLPRFGAVDPSDGGRTSRFSLSWQHEKGPWQMNAYAIRSALNLFSNFSYNLEQEAPLNADQFEQAERRQVLGGAISRVLFEDGKGNRTTLGAQLRSDWLSPVGLYSSLNAERVAAKNENEVRQASLGLYAEQSNRWTPWLRSVAGLRWDAHVFDVDEQRRSAQIASPKLSLIFGPWRQTEAFINWGYGLHSNDARGVVTDATPLVRAKGMELGLRGQWLPGLQASLSLWRLALDSELIFVGDAGVTEPGGASKRQGVELGAHWRVSRHLLLDADIAISSARFRSEQGEVPNAGHAVPGSAGRVASLGATLSDLGPWSAHLQWRYFGPRPLIEDGSQRSRGTSLTYLRIGHAFNKALTLNLDVFNLFNSKASDIDYYYASRLPGEPEGGVNDIHFHPVEPRSLRLTLRASF